MKNPFPEYGEIKQIIFEVEYSFPFIKSELFRYAEYPDVFTLKIKYAYFQCEYSCFNLTEEQYKELTTNMFDNAEFKLEQEGFPVKLVWKDFTFVPIKIESILYEKNQNL
jgi:hypothetical protein